MLAFLLIKILFLREEELLKKNLNYIYRYNTWTGYS